MQEDTVVTIASNYSQLPKVYVDAPALNAQQGAGFLPLQDAPRHLWSDAEDLQFSRELQAVCSQAVVFGCSVPVPFLSVPIVPAVYCFVAS